MTLKKSILWYKIRTGTKIVSQEEKCHHMIYYLWPVMGLRTFSFYKLHTFICELKIFAKCWTNCFSGGIYKQTESSKNLENVRLQIFPSKIHWFQSLDFSCTNFLLDFFYGGVNYSEKNPHNFGKKSPKNIKEFQTIPKVSIKISNPVKPSNE